MIQENSVKAWARSVLFMIRSDDDVAMIVCKIDNERLM